MKVFVYYNLRRKCWSIRCKGKVIGHSDKVGLLDCKLKVSEAGRQRVLREKRKNVHAGIEGIVCDWLDDGTCDIPLRYNPYTSSHFVSVTTFPRLVTVADAVVMDVNAK